MIDDFICCFISHCCGNFTYSNNCSRETSTFFSFFLARLRYRLSLSRSFTILRHNKISKMIFLWQFYSWQSRMSDTKDLFVSIPCLLLSIPLRCLFPPTIPSLILITIQRSSPRSSRLKWICNAFSSLALFFFICGTIFDNETVLAVDPYRHCLALWYERIESFRACWEEERISWSRKVLENLSMQISLSRINYTIHWKTLFVLLVHWISL